MYEEVGTKDCEITLTGFEFILTQQGVKSKHRIVLCLYFFVYEYDPIIYTVIKFEKYFQGHIKIPVPVSASGFGDG